MALLITHSNLYRRLIVGVKGLKWLSTAPSQGQELGLVGNLNLTEICKTGRAPEHFNFGKDVFDWHASQRPSHPALWFCNEKGDDRIWSFGEFRNESIRAGLVLREVLGPQKGNSPFVLTILSRIPEWWFLHMGAIRTGVIFCPGTTLLTTEDIQYRLEASSANLVVTDEENAEKIEKAEQKIGTSGKLKKLMVSKGGVSRDWISYEKLAKEVSPEKISSFKHAETKSDDIAQAFFTSGTTGKPKMVAHTHVSYGIGHIETAKQVGLNSNDLFWNISDPGWAKSSYSNFFTPWIAGCTVFIHQMKRFEPKPVLEALKQKPVSVLCAPPTLFKGMVPHSSQFQFKALRYALGAGEPLNPEVIRAWKNKTGNNIDQMYGQTEMTVVGCEVPGEDKSSSIGKPNGMYEVVVVDEKGKEVPRNEEGILAVKIKPIRPIGLTKGYLKQRTQEGELIWDDLKNKESFIGDFYLTGDKCFMDEQGFIFFIGRADDIINSSGYRIGPTEVESALQTHPAVVESAAVSSPDKDRGEVVKAFIVLNESFKGRDKAELIKEIQDHVKGQTAPYKYPRKIEFVESLPKTVSGKILRRELKRKEYEKAKA